MAMGKPFVIENVPNAPLINPLKLNGTMFGLRVIRRRLFELHGFEIWFAPKPYTLNGEVKKGKFSCIVGGGDAGVNIKLEKWQADIGIDWMNKQELTQAIPPAYTEYIGKYLMQEVRDWVSFTEWLLYEHGYKDSETGEAKIIMIDDTLVNQPSVEAGPKKGSKAYCELVTKIQGGTPFIRRIVVNGRPYWQRCQWIYMDGKRKLKVLGHLGTRKPRVKS